MKRLRRYETKDLGRADLFLDDLCGIAQVMGEFGPVRIEWGGVLGDTHVLDDANELLKLSGKPRRTLTLTVANIELKVGRDLVLSGYEGTTLYKLGTRVRDYVDLHCRRGWLRGSKGGDVVIGCIIGLFASVTLELIAHRFKHELSALQHAVVYGVSSIGASIGRPDCRVFMLRRDEYQSPWQKHGVSTTISVTIALVAAAFGAWLSAVFASPVQPVINGPAIATSATQTPTAAASQSTAQIFGETPPQGR